MCAHVDRNKTLRFLKRKKREIWVYKVVRYKIWETNERNLTSYYHDGYIWRYGNHTAQAYGDNSLELCLENSQKIYYGFHVFLDRKSALSFKLTRGLYPGRILKLKAHISNLICIDDCRDFNIAVFSKLKLLKKDYEETLCVQ